MVRPVALIALRLIIRSLFRFSELTHKTHSYVYGG